MQRRTVFESCLCSLLLSLSCRDVSGDVRMRVFAPDAGGKYELVDTPVSKVTSVRELSSDRFNFRKNAGIELGFGGRLQKHRGNAFALNFHLENGVVVTDDQESLFAATAFAHLSRTAQALEAVGLPPYPSMEVLFHPRIDSFAGDLRFILQYNAAYASDPLDLFLIVPGATDGLPFFSNLGVVAHEYGHSVINHLSLHGVMKSRSVDSMNEGVADLIGYAVTGRPSFIADSIWNDKLLAKLDRDLSKPKTYTTKNLEQLKSPTASFVPHFHGAILAAAVFESLSKDDSGAVSEATRRELAATIIATLQSDPFRNEGNALNEFVTAYVAHLSTERRANACSVFNQRLAPLGPFSSCEGQ